jgi:hypothetical protein
MLLLPFQLLPSTITAVFKPVKTELPPNMIVV